MKSEELLDAIGQIKDEWIKEAHAPRVRRHRVSLLAAVLAAALVLSLSAFAVADSKLFSKETPIFNEIVGLKSGWKK